MNIASTKIIARIGSKEVVIKNHGQEKCISLQYFVLLLMLLNYLQYWSLKTAWRKSREEKKKNLIQSQKIFAYCQRKAWNNETIMKRWISDIWRKYSYFDLKKETMLVMDDASMHKLDVIKKKKNDWEATISMIPGGLTRYLQPLNASINKPFKDELRKKYIDCWMETKNSKAKVSQNEFINWAWEVWYSKSIYSNIIRKSF